QYAPLDVSGASEFAQHLAGGVAPGRSVVRGRLHPGIAATSDQFGKDVGKLSRFVGHAPFDFCSRSRETLVRLDRSSPYDRKCKRRPQQALSSFTRGVVFLHFGAIFPGPRIIRVHPPRLAIVANQSLTTSATSRFSALSYRPSRSIPIASQRH